MQLSPEDLTSTPANYASPDQLAQSREYAKYLLQGGGQQPVHHWAQGLSNMVGSLLGGNRNYQANQQQTQNTFGAGQEVAAVRPPGAPPQGAMGPQASGGVPASVRNNNPGAQWPGSVASQFGATGSQTIGGGNKIASFPDPVSGAAAEFALLDKNYAGMPIGSAISKWSGGNSASAYAQHIAQRTGLTPDTVITPQLLRSPQGVALGKAMADWEAGGRSPLTDQQWAQAHQKAFGQAGGGQTADLSGRIGGSSPPAAASPQAMSGALAASGRPPPTGAPPTSSEGGVTLGPQYAPQRPHIGQGQMGRILGNQWVAPEIRDSLYGQYMQQYQPVELGTTGGKIIFPSGGGQPASIPDLQKFKEGAEGAETTTMGTVTSGPDGKPRFEAMPGASGVGGTQSGPPPDFSHLPPIHPPAAKPIGPQSSAAPSAGPATAAQAASPMGQQASAGATPLEAAPQAGAKTALAVPGNTASDAPPIGGMLSTPPPQAQAQSPAGPQVAQASTTGSRLNDLAQFGLSVKKQGELNTDDAKKYTDNVNGLQQSGNQAMQGLPMIGVAKEMVQDPRFYSGKFSDQVLAFKQLQSALGNDPNKSGPMEIFDKSMAGDILNQLKSKLQGLGQVRNAEINLVNRATANLHMTPAANMAVLNIIERGYNQVVALSQLAEGYAKGARLDAKGNYTQAKPGDLPTNAGLNTMLQEYLKNNPMFSPQEIKDYNHTLDIEPKATPAQAQRAGHPQPMATPAPGFSEAPPPPPGNWQEHR